MSNQDAIAEFDLAAVRDTLLEVRAERDRLRNRNEKAASELKNLLRFLDEKTPAWYTAKRALAALGGE